MLFYESASGDSQSYMHLLFDGLCIKVLCNILKTCTCSEQQTCTCYIACPQSPSRLKHSTKNAIFGVMAACAVTADDQVAPSNAAEH